MRGWDKETINPVSGGPGWSELGFRCISTRVQLGDVLYPAQAVVPTDSHRAEALSGRDTRVQTYVRVQIHAGVCGRMWWRREGLTVKEGARDLGTSLVVQWLRILLPM